MSFLKTRRRFLTDLASAGAAGGLAGVGASGLIGATQSFAADPPPETSEIRFENIPIYCEAPRYIAEELLRAEGFTIRHVEFATGQGLKLALAHGEDDFAFLYAPDAITGWMPACRSQCSPACTSDASSCSGANRSAVLLI
jgi:NitT/TauT family transport system substrate-binding protein